MILQLCAAKINGTIENKQLNALHYSEVAGAIHPSWSQVMCAIFLASDMLTDHVGVFQFRAIQLCATVK